MHRLHWRYRRIRRPKPERQEYMERDINIACTGTDLFMCIHTLFKMSDSLALLLMTAYQR
jgi:hypothetical protein